MVCKETCESKVIAFNLCGHGYFDMQSYINYFNGKIQNLDYSKEDLQKALENVPVVV
ncbi:MAG: hypothetical protein HUU54_12575 [Ignavibacteriaceae bacterium]|nr:hypothetical protein [Ignavibacteriaceae bacterium]